MKLTWLGHSCFLIEEAGFTIAVDPFRGVRGYRDSECEANFVVCSHQHGDHNAVDLVKMTPAKVPNPFYIKEIHCFHDEARGSKRGPNVIRVFCANGVRVAHLGDLGHVLSPEQAAEVGRLDAVLIPVGGHFTIDAKEAAEVVRQLAPKAVIPMHYRKGELGYDVIGTLDPFLEEMKGCPVTECGGNSVEITGKEEGVFVLEYV